MPSNLKYIDGNIHRYTRMGLINVRITLEYIIIKLVEMLRGGGVEWVK